MTIGGLLKNAVRINSPIAKSRGAIIKAFARKLGLVYFGVVDQHLDDFEVIRGLTISTTHQDNHYAVGSYDGTDISMVDRFDVIVDYEGNQSRHNWLIIQIDLHPAEALPHIFLKPIDPRQPYDKLFRANTTLYPINQMLQGGHSPEFHGRYELLTVPARALEIEALFTPEVTQTIAARFWPHALEIFEDKLYLYITETTLTATLLEAGVSSALWLVDVLEQSEESQN